MTFRQFYPNFGSRPRGFPGPVRGKSTRKAINFVIVTFKNTLHVAAKRSQIYCRTSRFRVFDNYVILLASMASLSESREDNLQLVAQAAFNLGPSYRVSQSLPKGPENRCRAKMVKTCRNFLTIDIFALREKCRKVWKIFLTFFMIFDVCPLSAGPFCGPLSQAIASPN